MGGAAKVHCQPQCRPRKIVDPFPGTMTASRRQSLKHGYRFRSFIYCIHVMVVVMESVRLGNVFVHPAQVSGRVLPSDSGILGGSGKGAGPSTMAMAGALPSTGSTTSAASDAGQGQGQLLLSDISIRFEDGTVLRVDALASATLMTASPVFHKMLTHEMKEKERREIELPGKDPKQFETLLKFLMPSAGRKQKLSDENVGFLRKLCEEYMIETLREDCFMNA